MKAPASLRILIELSSSDRKIGAVNDALDLAHYARGLGVHFFLCGPIDREMETVARAEGMRPVGGRSRIISKRGAVLYAMSVCEWMVRLAFIRPHVVHLNYSGYGPSLACAARMLRIPIVVRAASTYTPKNLLNRWADLYVANGRAHAQSLFDSPLSSRVRVTGDLFRPERLDQLAAEQPIPSRTGRTRFLFMGQLVERKGIMTLVEAFGRVRGDADLLLVGGDWQAPGYPALVRQRIEELGLVGRVHCENHRQDVAALLQDCDVFVVPSLSEARPRVIIEAMCMRRPIIASAVGGIPELVDNGVTGLLVPPSDADALAEALERLADSPDLRARLGARGCERAEREFKPERAVNRYLDVYREVTGRRQALAH